MSRLLRVVLQIKEQLESYQTFRNTRHGPNRWPYDLSDSISASSQLNSQDSFYWVPVEKVERVQQVDGFIIEAKSIDIRGDGKI